MGVILEVTFINKRTGKDFIMELEKIYGFIDNLKKQVYDDPEHPLYTLDLNDWTHLIDNPTDLVETNQQLTIEDFEFELPEVHVIVEKNPLIAFHFPYIEREDLLKTELEYRIKNGKISIKFERGHHTPKPVIIFKDIEIEID